MRKGYIFVLILVVISALYLTLSRPDEIIGPELELAVFGDKGLLYIPFIQELSDVAVIKITADKVVLNDDVLVPVRTSSRIGVPVSNVSNLSQGTNISVSVNGTSHVRPVSKISIASDVLELSKVTNPEDSMKGWAQVAYAQVNPTENAYRPGVPDIAQAIAECAPTSAANSLISLMDEHGVTPPSDGELISQLKADMDWTPENGVLPPQFVEGKNKWAARNGLPIRTRIVGDQHGRGTLEAIMDSLANGSAAEVRIKFADANGKVTGGHMVTVVGVRTEGGQTYLEVNDPRTPEGTDVYEINGNVIEDYPYDGVAVISWGFVQTWEGSPTGVELDLMNDAEIQGIQNFVGQKEKIKVIPYNGKKIPLSEVTVIKGEHCDSPEKQYPHYHASKGGSVTATDGTVIADHNECGFGKVKDVPVEEIEK